jgi:hypothetical protein
MAKKKGTKKSTTKKISDEDISKRLYEWIAEGYEVEPLMKAVQSKDHTKIQRNFKKFDKNIRRMDRLKTKLEEMGYDEDNPRYNEISKVLKDPNRVIEVEEFLQSIAVEPKLKELQGELASLNVSGFEKEAEEIKAKFNDPEKIEEIEKDITALKRRIKEKFFEEAFEDVVVSKKAEDAIKGSIAETIFLLHRDGTLLAVKSKIPPKNLNKRLMSRMVMAIREQMGKAFKEGQHVHSLTYEGHTIILEDSIHVYAAVVVKGEATPVMYKIILKALQIMERKLKHSLENWTGDRSTLENLEKYTTAIFQAFEKLG